MTNDAPRSNGRPPARAIPNERSGENGSGAPLHTQPFETDGGFTDGGAADGVERELATYTDEERGYSVDYPADWSVETDADGGATFEDATSTAGAVVFVDENCRDDLAAYAERFHGDLVADDHVHGLERLDRRPVRLPSGHRGRVVECSYIGDAPDERWRLTYLFVIADDTGYTVGVDWAVETGFEGVARTVVESFALATDSTE